MEEFKRYLTTKTDHIKQSTQAYKFCFCFSRIFRLKMAEPPEDVVNVFRDYSDKGVMSVEQLYDFLKHYQGEEKITIKDAQDIFTKHHYVFQSGLNLNAFFSYLSGDHNPPISTEVHHDMTAPLAHYFVYTGHNSYLTGNQFTSNSSIKPIIRALKNGVRVIELDLWPSKKGDVEVCHGGTWTSSVKLSKCLQAIKDNAFKASEFPVIITFEDHLKNALLRQKVAEMVSATFGGMLYHRTDFHEFPSPETLKGKILISSKPPELIDSHKDDEHGDLRKQEFNDKAVPVVLEGGDSKHESSAQTKINKDVKDEEEEISDDQDNCDDTSMNEKPISYKNMITIPGIKRGEFKESLKVHPYKLSRLSWSEQTLANAIISHGTDIVRYTQKNILRIFPRLARIDSSNYDPFVGWIHGAQMVAFNMQGYGKPLWLMQGMFRANGGCGYVKKPEFLLKLSPEGEVFDPKADLPIKLTLKVKVYMGDGWRADFKQTHFDLFSPPDFYVKVGIAGAAGDETMNRTKAIEDSWTPVWDEEFSFPLKVPELALLTVEVYEYDTSKKDDFAGQTCLPVSELKPGFRALSLYNSEGQKYASVKLLMRFMFV
ncbi:hypothetical protein RND81_05G260000 [Saponaria officinalis]|uniref:Phosphoinositide phospholipase C n=1 Tax=Saponaria officinalis TaxID=3572 RepID=A0AAW1L234_SAPOF